MEPSASTPLGATPDLIPLMRPKLPAMTELAPYLAEIDENRWYTNFGPLVRRFEKRLARHFCMPETGLALVANGTTGLSAALLALGAKAGSKCLVPTWTFVASAAAIWAASLRPHFIDVSIDTWQPDPKTLSCRADLGDVGAVMVVSPFGSPIDTKAWDQFFVETGIPVILDGAAAFDTAATVAEARPRNSPLMISLHATKAFGIGEGGLLVSTDEAFIHRLRQVSNFGIWGSHEGQILGYNGKLSEYHAAVGLAALDGWPMRRAALMSRTRRYLQELKRIPNVRLVPGYGDGWVSNYCTVLLSNNVPSIVERMAAMGVETRRWWMDGVHQQPAYRQFSRDDLPVSATLASRAISLPFSHDISDEQIAYVVSTLNRAVNA